jgi:hypothetical protein
LLLCYFRRFDTNVYTKDLGNVQGSPLRLLGLVIGDLLDEDPDWESGLGRTWPVGGVQVFILCFLFSFSSTAAVFESIRAVLALATLCISATDMGGSGVVESGWRVSCFRWCMRSGCALSKMCSRKCGGLRQNMDSGLNGESTTQRKAGVVGITCNTKSFKISSIYHTIIRDIFLLISSEGECGMGNGLVRYVVIGARSFAT